MSWWWGGGDTMIEATTKDMQPRPPKGFATLAVHLDHSNDAVTGAIMPPISLSTTFEQRSPGVPLGVRETFSMFIRAPFLH